MTACRLIIFVKWPEKGKVKTRLAAAIGEEGACKLYKCFVEDTVAMAGAAGFRPLIAYCPEEAGSRVAAWLGNGKDYMPQSGRDLGEKMKNAFKRVFEDGCLQAVLIGSDIPDLPPAIITEAFSALENKQAVIGPAKDGGYYLIGFRRDAYAGQVFRGMSWGSSDIFERSIAVLEREGIDVYVLPVWSDMDRPADIAELVKRNSEGPFMRSKTMSYLRNKTSFILI
ncbi:MAG TPA: TIGR04282 family arsenosugar biosynthesis glycosyltransferase [Dissulfurispiraceae bacterium]|nr:TIGR04282 family arsenosugar biosynthesis glycosyltransferase [Dissulfurispiraceae bacterium]